MSGNSGDYEPERPRRFANGRAVIEHCLRHPVALPPYWEGPFRPGDLAKGDRISFRRNGRIRVGKVREMYRRGVRVTLLPYSYDCAVSYANVLRLHLPGPCQEPATD